MGNAKSDDYKMVDMILNGEPKTGNGYGSTQNLASSAGALPGQRTRIRQSNGNDTRAASISTSAGTKSNQQPGTNGNGAAAGKMMDVPGDDGFMDALISSSSATRNLPTKKTRRYASERKSCKEDLEKRSLSRTNRESEPIPKPGPKSETKLETKPKPELQREE